MYAHRGQSSGSYFFSGPVYQTFNKLRLICVVFISNLMVALVTEFAIMR